MQPQRQAGRPFILSAPWVLCWVHTVGWVSRAQELCGWHQVCEAVRLGGGHLPEVQGARGRGRRVCRRHVCWATREQTPSPPPLVLQEMGCPFAKCTNKGCPKCPKGKFKVHIGDPELGFDICVL